MKKLLFLMILSAQCYGQLPTGTMVLGSVNAVCPAGFSCHNFTVQCPNVVDVHPVTGNIARWQTPNPIGAILLFSGHGGTNWWSTSAMGQTWFQRMHDAGYDVIQLRWQGNGWPNSWGYPQGFSRLACRPATAIKWVHDNWVTGRYVVAGISEGSAALGYSLSRYGVFSLIDTAIMVSGPPMADLADGCMDLDPHWAYVIAAETALIDQPWGYTGAAAPSGPCRNHNASWVQTWIDNSVETGGTDYFYPNTKIAFLEGGRDAANIRNHASKFYDVLNRNAQPNLSWTVVPTMPHPIQNSQDGLNVLFNLATQ